MVISPTGHPEQSKEDFRLCFNISGRFKLFSWSITLQYSIKPSHNLSRLNIHIYEWHLNWCIVPLIMSFLLHCVSLLLSPAASAGDAQPLHSDVAAERTGTPLHHSPEEELCQVGQGHDQETGCSADTGQAWRQLQDAQGRVEESQ